MPSLFKKLLYGKELSNPYVNRYHPGHTAQVTPQQQQQQQQQQKFYPTYPQPATHFPTPPTPPPRAESPVYSDFLGEARLLAGRDPVTGRAVQSGRAGGSGGAGAGGSGSGRAGESEIGRGRASLDSTAESNPYIHGGDAAMGRPVPRGVVNHAGIFVQSGGARVVRESVGPQQSNSPHGNSQVSTAPEQGNRYDIFVRDEQRKREAARSGVAAAGPSTRATASGSVAASALAASETEYYAPARPPVREFYGGA